MFQAVEIPASIASLDPIAWPLWMEMHSLMLAVLWLPSRRRGGGGHCCFLQQDAEAVCARETASTCPLHESCYVLKFLGNLSGLGSEGLQVLLA